MATAWRAWQSARPILRQLRAYLAARQIQAHARQFLVASSCFPVVREKPVFGVHATTRPHRRLGLAPLEHHQQARNRQKWQDLPPPWASSLVDAPFATSSSLPTMASDSVLKPIPLLVSKRAAVASGLATIPTNTRLSPNDLVEFAKASSLVADGVSFNVRDAVIIADALSANSTVRKLLLYNGRLGNRGTTAIMRSIFRNPNNRVEHIAIGANRVGFGALDDFVDMMLQSTMTPPSRQVGVADAAGVQPLAPQRGHLRPHVLVFEHNPRIGASGAELLSQVISNPNCCLTTLNLDFCAVGNSGAAVLAASLFQNTTVKELSLRGNALTDRGASALSMALGVVATSSGVSSLDESRSHRRTRSSVSSRGWRRKEPVPNTRHCRLQSLRLGHNYIGDLGMCKILAAMMGSTKVLNLSSSPRPTTSVTSPTAGAAVVPPNRPHTSPPNAAASFQVTSSADHPKKQLSSSTSWGTVPSTIVELDMSHNKLGDESARAVANALVCIACRHVRRIDLRSNIIGVDGMNALQDAICAENSHTTVTSRPTTSDFSSLDMQSMQTTPALPNPFADHVNSKNGWMWSSDLEVLHLAENPGSGSAACAAVEDKLRIRLTPVAYIPHAAASGADSAKVGNVFAASNSKHKTSKWLADLPKSVLARANKFRKFQPQRQSERW